MTPQQTWDLNCDRVVRDGRFATGDLAVYGPPYAVTAVVECCSPGDSMSAWFLLDGRQVRLTHRADLLAVVRPG